MGLSREDAEHVILVRGAGELQVGDVVKMLSLQTEAFNGLLGTLMRSGSATPKGGLSIASKDAW